MRVARADGELVGQADEGGLDWIGWIREEGDEFIRLSTTISITVFFFGAQAGRFCFKIHILGRAGKEKRNVEFILTTCTFFSCFTFNLTFSLFCFVSFLEGLRKCVGVCMRRYVFMTARLLNY